MKAILAIAIADKLGYKNHSKVQKIIKKIGLTYQELSIVGLAFAMVIIQGIYVKCNKNVI